MAPLTYQTGLHKDVISDLILLPSTGELFQSGLGTVLFLGKTSVERFEHAPHNVKYQSLGSDNPFFFSGLNKMCPIISFEQYREVSLMDQPIVLPNPW